MKELPQSLFDVYALALPRGHGFGNALPIHTWQSDDGLAFGVVTCNEKDSFFGLLVARRRIDNVWTVIADHSDIRLLDEALHKLSILLKSGEPPEPIPSNTAPRPVLYDFKNRQVSDLFKLLTKPSHHIAAWMLNQLYLALPSPDANWAGDFQTSNFHTRMWEVQLLATFREQGLLVTQPSISPDFLIENRHGDIAWVEAVTANPKRRYNHVNAEPSKPPKNMEKRLIGEAAERFAKTIGNKLGKKYCDQPDVSGKPFIIALADFHAPGSMTWSRGALMSYLYGAYPLVEVVNGQRTASLKPIKRLLGESQFPAGLFCNQENSELSAIIFTNACTIGKFNRVGVSAGANANGLRYIRIGEFYDRTPGALAGIPFCLDISSSEYRSLWPQGYEPWCAEIEVFHNPYAKHPVSKKLLPEITHWYEDNKEIVCSSFYETSILYSKTLIQNETDKMPSIHELMAKDSCKR
ncbi:hypothetical protein [uncultured Shewanella sp.]|uniref:hypothetical protein n=1 Tax=uncultured Shewanella sp. TaxID=173975 RepID=UPI00262EC84D|nr:hypothetical protein [uncultured Shewanella sp.]